MAHIPSLEETLTQVRKSFGLKRNPQESGFAKFELSIQGSVSIAHEIIKGILKALGIDEHACVDLLGNVDEWATFNKGLELNVWTGKASQQQVVWHMLAYVYVPVLARRLAFWVIHNLEHQLPSIDTGMSGGSFWFLPAVNQEAGTIEMPIKQVLNWLIDISGESSIDALLAPSTDANIDSHIRTLHNWLEGTLPKSSEMIDEIFSDNLVFETKGTFHLQQVWTLDERFNAAMRFAQSKGLFSALMLHAEIPMSIERISTLYGSEVIDSDKDDFVKQIAARYAKPSSAIIRQRLKVARLVQDGYFRLNEYLNPGVDDRCIDPEKNKLLQLLGLFQTIYNLTIKAFEIHPHSIEQQDVWFEQNLAPWDKADLLMAITPSIKNSACLLLAERFTRKFMLLTPEAPLENLVPWNLEVTGNIIKNRLGLVKQQHDEDTRLIKLRERIRVASPWRALLEEESFWVLSQLAFQNLSSKLFGMVLKRMRELAETDGQTVHVNLIEIEGILHAESKYRAHGAKETVQRLIAESENSFGFEEWKAPLLRMRAKHRLFQNDFSGAISDFKLALEACKERGFGGLRGEVARDGFATELMVYGFVPENQEVYYRNWIAFAEFSEGVPAYEDAAVLCEELFWESLYQPYSDIDPEFGLPVSPHKSAIKETTKLIFDADWDGLSVWLNKNAKKYRNRRIKEARRNSLLLAWLKLLHSQEVMFSTLKHLPTSLQNQLGSFSEVIQNYRQSIVILIKAWPEQAKISDFKGQTPLILVADNGDEELTKQLIPFSDINAQDYLGRTALHAAVTSNSKACVSAILDCEDLDVTRVTKEGNTALHMSVRFGLPEVAGLMLKDFPGLRYQENLSKETPQSMALNIYKNFNSWKDFMHLQSRHIGTKEDLEQIIAMFEALES